MKRGCFITFEGIDGSGKSTQISKLKDYLEGKDCRVVLTREPGGTDIGEKIRTLILDPENGEMTAMTEALLYAASRAQHVEELIKPEIDAGSVVICDRFIDSSIAYQGYGRRLGEGVSVINTYALSGCMPDITFFIDVKPDIGTDRIGGRDRDRIELETQAFHADVYDGYLELARKFTDRIAVIDGTGSVEQIQAEIRRRMDVFMRERYL